MSGFAKRSVQAISPAWTAYAENIVANACILDDTTAEGLVQAFAAVPRDKFVERSVVARVFEDEELPIGFEQYSSRPSAVARMLGLIGIRPRMKILEVGCGSGYCSAVMASAGAQVFSVEYIGLLAQATRKRLDALSYQNVIVKRGDGRRGWEEHAPFDAIVVSAAFETIPQELIAQLQNPGGRMVAPVGNALGQILTLWEAKGGGVTLYQLEPCSFSEGVTTISYKSTPK